MADSNENSPDPLSDLAPGELDALLGEADADIGRGDVIDGEQALRDRRRRRAEQAKRAG